MLNNRYQNNMSNQGKLEENHYPPLFHPGFYTVTKIIEKDLFQVENVYLIKLKVPYSQFSIKDGTFLNQLKEKIVKIIPHHRNNKGEIISDVWIGDIHINKEVFSDTSITN